MTFASKNKFHKTFAPRVPLQWTRELAVAVTILAVLTAFRLWFCTYPDIMADEAYYWLWSKHLDASYYSKGPGIAWTIAFGTKVFGDTAFGIRWVSVMLAAGTGWQLFILARRLFDERTAVTCLAIGSVIPLLAIGSVLMTIDPLSVFFWAWAANLFLDALGEDRWRDWGLLGFAVGLGFLAKYVNALQLLCFLAFLVWTPSQRGHLRNPKVLFALGVFLLCTLPVFWWNQHHGWITATHLKERGALNHRFRFSPGEFFQFFTMQGLVMSPLLFAGFLIALFATLFARFKSEAQKYLLCLTVPIFGFYSVLAWNDNGEANWTATGYIGALILIASYWTLRCRLSLGWRWAAGAALGLALLETLALHETAPLHLQPNGDPLTRVRGWDDFGREVESVRAKVQPQILIGNRYQTAALMAWYLPGRPQTFVPNADRIQNQFSFWPGYHAEPGATALFVTDEMDTIPARLRQEYKSIEKVGTFWTKFQDRKLREYYIYRCQ